MRFSCKSCKAQYSIADEKIRGKVIKVRCKKCNRLLVVRDNSGEEFSQAPQTEANVLNNPTLEQEFDRAFDGILEERRTEEEQYTASAMDLEPVWYCGLDGAEDGPLTLLDLEERIRDGRITQEHFVWRDGLEDWLPIEECNELVHLFRFKPAPTPSSRKAKPKKQKERRRAGEKERRRAGEKERRRAGEKERRRAEEKERRQAEEKERRQAEEKEQRRAEEKERRRAEEKERRRAEEKEQRRAEEKEQRRAEEKEQRRAEEEEQRRAEEEEQRQAEEEEQRRAEEEEQRQAEEEEQRRAEEEEQRQAEEEEQRRAEEEKQLKSKEEKKRRAEEEKKRRAEEKKRRAEEKKRKAEEEKKRKADEKEERKKRKQEILQREAQEQILQQEEEIQRRIEDEKLLIQEQKRKQKEDRAKQKKDRQQKRPTQQTKPTSQQATADTKAAQAEPVGEAFKRVETDVHTRQISDDFFTSGERAKEQEELLPLPPVIDLEAADAARALAEEIEDEQESQEEMESIGSRREEWGEISRVIAKQAGVASQGRRSAVGLLVVVLVLACLISLVALALSQGWFSNEFEHFQKSKKDQSSVMVNTQASEKLSSKDHQRISGIWNVEQKRKKQAKQQARPSVAGPLAMNLPSVDDSKPKVLSKDEKELLAFYEQQNEQKRELAPRGPMARPSSIAKINMPSTGMNFNMESNLEKKIEATPNERGPLGRTNQLTQEQVKLVINRHKRQIQKCLERQLKRDPISKGKALVTAIVLPNGTVKQVDIEPAKFHGTYLEECMKREIKLWRFPSFKGEPTNLQFPFILKARESY